MGDVCMMYGVGWDEDEMKFDTWDVQRKGGRRAVEWNGEGYLLETTIQGWYQRRHIRARTCNKRLCLGDFCIFVWRILLIVLGLFNRFAMGTVYSIWYKYHAVILVTTNH
jgi:hypothetical protein